MSVFIRRFLLVFVGLGVLGAFGTAGYVVLEGWSFGDALYMSAITITAVGYEEVHHLTDRGRTFTMLLLGGGITWMGVWFALITSLIVELDLSNVFRRRRLTKEIDSLEDHVVVCGAGRTGGQVAEELKAMKTPLVVVEKDPAQVEIFRKAHPDVLTINGDATHDLTLLQAGLDRARGLVTCLSADTDNLFVCLSARDLKPDLTIVVRAYEEETMDKLYRAGATHVVSPNMSGAIRMASVLLRPSVVSFLDIATRSSDLSLRMEQVEIPPTSPLAGRSLAEAGIPQETGLIVIAMREPTTSGRGGFVFNPAAATTLDPGDELIVLGTVDQIELLRKYVGV